MPGNTSRRDRKQTMVWLTGFALMLSLVLVLLFVARRQAPDEIALTEATDTAPAPLPGPARSPAPTQTIAIPAGAPTPIPWTGAPEPTGEFDRTGTLWAPYLEWSLENTGYSGNPFDVEAAVTFVHPESGETRRTYMFYDGGNTWKFRFTGTRTGEWTFTTGSEAVELDGRTGKILIQPNPDPGVKGFLVNKGNKFARQVGENGELEAVIFNVWQGGDYPNGVNNWHNNPNIQVNLDEGIEKYLERHGMTAMYSGSIANRWFNMESWAWDEHDSQDPDIRTFEALEQAITYLHARGFHLHIWMWGDETRRQTPIGVGGVNGVPDRRIQRYIAARLGPLPGWSMSYGFDLGDHDWINGDTNLLDDWAAYLNERMGWPHLLFTRGYATPRISGISYSSNGPGSPAGAIQTSPNGPASYDEVAGHMESDRSRPHLYEERFIYLREFDGGPQWTMDRTRRVMWWNAMAGGMGAFWGVWDGPLYPNPEQMRTHHRFWDGRFTLDMERANQLTDGVALVSPGHGLYIFYKEDASSLRMDLSGLGNPQTAIAVDTKKAYEEIDLGMLAPQEQVWTAPYESDWAVAVGGER